MYTYAGTYSIRNQTDPDKDANLTEKTSIHRVFLPERCYFYIIMFN